MTPAQRVDGRADIVPESRQGHLGGAGAAAEGVFRLDEQRLAAGPGQRNRGRQAVRSRSNDDGIVFVCSRF